MDISLNLSKKSFAVYGLGTTGRSVINYFNKAGFKNYVIWDDNNVLRKNWDLDEKKKKACKPTKGKASAKRVDGKCVSYGQKGKAKGGGNRVQPGTSKGDAYCARSYGDMKSHGKDCSGKDRSTPLCLSRQKWDCSGKYSRK